MFIVLILSSFIGLIDKIDYYCFNFAKLFQRPRAAAEISPVNECRKIQVEFDATSKVKGLQILIKIILNLHCNTIVF
jgi:hypothetical protein